MPFRAQMVTGFNPATDPVTVAAYTDEYSSGVTFEQGCDARICLSGRTAGDVQGLLWSAIHALDAVVAVETAKLTATGETLAESAGPADHAADELDGIADGGAEPRRAGGLAVAASKASELTAASDVEYALTVRVRVNLEGLLRQCDMTPELFFGLPDGVRYELLADFETAAAATEMAFPGGLGQQLLANRSDILPYSFAAPQSYDHVCGRCYRALRQRNQRLAQQAWDNGWLAVAAGVGGNARRLEGCPGGNA